MIPTLKFNEDAESNTRRGPREHTPIGGTGQYPPSPPYLPQFLSSNGVSAVLSLRATLFVYRLCGLIVQYSPLRWHAGPLPTACRETSSISSDAGCARRCQNGFFKLPRVGKDYLIWRQPFQSPSTRVCHRCPRQCICFSVYVSAYMSTCPFYRLSLSLYRRLCLSLTKCNSVHRNKKIKIIFVRFLQISLERNLQGEAKNCTILFLQ